MRLGARATRPARCRRSQPDRPARYICRCRRCALRWARRGDGRSPRMESGTMIEAMRDPCRSSRAPPAGLPQQAVNGAALRWTPAPKRISDRERRRDNGLREGRVVISPALHRETTAQRLSERSEAVLRIREPDGIGLVANPPPRRGNAGLAREAMSCAYLHEKVLSQTQAAYHTHTSRRTQAFFRIGLCLASA